MSPQLNLYEIVKQNDLSYSCIIKTNFLTPDKYWISNESFVRIPNLILFETNNSSFKKKCHYHKTFDKSTIVYFKNFDIFTYKYLIPQFYCKKFRCMNCNVSHNSNSKKCCDLLKSPIEIVEADLIKIYLPEINSINLHLKNSRELFLKLHFPDILDKIMIR